MPSPDKELFRRWGHSFEEDHDGILVYRPADFDFPRARGRDGLEFRPNGDYVDWAVGRADAREAKPGNWLSEETDRLRLTSAAGSHRVIEVLRVTPDRLEIRARSEG